MSRLFGPYTVALGVNNPIPLPGTQNALMAIRVYNYTLWSLNIQIAGQTLTIPAETRDLILIDPAAQWDGQLLVTAAQDILVPLGVSGPTIIRVVGFGAGEPIPGNDPITLVHTVAGGVLTTTASNLVNTGGVPGTQVIQISDNETLGPRINASNDGTLQCSIDSTTPVGSATTYLQATPGVHSGPRAVVQFGSANDPLIATFYGQLNALSSDGANLTSDGVNGTLTKIGGLATVGALGAAPIVAQPSPNPFHAIATGAANVVSFTPPATQPTYRISGSLNIANGSTATCTLSVSYNDVRGVARTQFFNTYGGVAINGAVLATGDYPLEVMTIGGVFNTAAFTISYNDSTGTPNDRLTLHIERLA